MTPTRWCLAHLCLLLVCFAACGGSDADDADTGADARIDAGADVASDATPDAGETPDAGDTDGTGADSGDDAEDADDADADEGPCLGSLLCLDEVSGNPSRRVCLDNGFPEGTTCERQGDVACCVPPFACATNADCEASRESESFCADPRFPCLCDVDSGACFTGVCSADAECGEGERCLDGVCVAAPEASTLVARILTQPNLVGQGDEVPLVAVAVNADDPSQVDVSAPITWTLETEGTDASIDDEGVLSVGTSANALLVRAQVAANPDDVGDTLELFAADPDGITTVWVWDEHSRTPIEGATVVVNGEARTTFAGGAVGGWQSEPPYEVHVFAEGYTYVSLFGVDESSIYVPLAPHTRAQIAQLGEDGVCASEDPDLVATADASESCGGTTERACLCYALENVDVVRGTPDYALTPVFGDTQVALSGFALGNSLLDLNFDLILGPEITRDLGALADDAAVPSGVTLEFNGEGLVESYVATAPAGERLVWTVGGRVTLTAILPDILGQIGGTLEVGPLIALVLPFFEDFYSGVSSPVAMNAAGTFPVRDPALELRVPTQRRTQVDVPSLPELPRGWTDTVIVLGGVLVPGQGFVPTGISGGADATGDEEPDGEIDADADEAGLQPLPLAMAPMHGPTLSAHSQYMVAAVALMLNDDFEGAPAQASAGVLRTLEPGSLVPSDVDFGVDAFPSFSFGAEWSFATRTLELGEGDADMFRIVFEGQRERRWIVYAPAGTTSITLPAPSGDLDFVDHTANEDVTVVGVSLRDLDYADVVRADHRNLSDLFAYISGFSILGL